LTLPDRSLIKGSLLAPFCVPALHVLVSAEVAYTQRIPAPKLSCYHVLLSWTFTAFSTWIARAAGKPWTFALCTLAVLVWAATGPSFGFSETWQLIINTGTTIVTFLMVFLIQNTQNRDGAAIQVKLDELIRTSAAQNLYIGIERLTEEELEEIRKRCEERAKGFMAEKAAKAADKAQDNANRKAAAAVKRAVS